MPVFLCLCPPCHRNQPDEQSLQSRSEVGPDRTAPRTYQNGLNLRRGLGHFYCTNPEDGSESGDESTDSEAEMTPAEKEYRWPLAIQ